MSSFPAQAGIPLLMASAARKLLQSMSKVGKRMDYRKIITIEPGKRGGKPCIRGMRITVYDVLSYLASGMSEEEILRDFPYLTKEDILASLAYAADREQAKLTASS
jgi:uncharacterized protein (DUF433 family)